MVKTGRWEEVTIALNGTTSSEINLGLEFRDVQVYSPAIDSATITIKSSRKSGETAVNQYRMTNGAASDYVDTTTARTAAGAEIFKDVCAQFITIVLGAAQTTLARTLYVRGIDPL
jgi:hypothetical protein